MAWLSAVGGMPLVGLSLLVPLGGCGPKGLSYTAHDGSRVTRDDVVHSWNVNGEDVYLPHLDAEPGCFVLVVKYKVVYERLSDDAVVLPGTDIVGLAAEFVQVAAQIKHTEYDSSQVAFALPVRRQHRYWITATFTGEEFLPRIVESNAEGERVRQIDPSKSMQEIADCKANKLKPPAP